MNKTFYPKTEYFGWNKRAINIKINEDYITFHFKDEGDREFYYIPKTDWINDKTEILDREDNWHFHMKEKVWFTNEMESFINKNA
jgi:hypothetical protein